jgi:hypothetical protein
MRMICWVALLAATPVAAAPGKCDLSTDAGIDAAYQSATGETISSYGGRCVQHSTTFPAMIAIGSFLSDYGCRWSGALHGCKWNDPDAARVEMAAAGWAKADAKKRQALALAWLREVDQVTVQDENVSDDHGKLVIDFWQPGHVGMNPTPPPRSHHRVVFAGDGSHGAIAGL